MAHLTPERLADVEARYGTPVELSWTYPISEPEIRMVIASTRGQMRLHDVTLFIFDDDGRLALIRKHGYPEGAWRAPGGGVHPGEDFAVGALREAKEETGLTATLERYLLRVHVTFTWADLTQPWTTHVVTARTHEKALATRDPKEIESARWGTLAELVGPIEQALLNSGRGLFRYRVALHREVARMLNQ